MRRLVAMGALALASAAGDARALVAQAAPALPAAVGAGARVRVTLPDSLRQAAFAPRAQTLIGTVARVRADTLWLHVPGTAGELRVEPGALRRLAVSRGVPGRAESALREGLGTAVVTALLFALTSDPDSDRGPRFDSRGEAAAAGGAIGFGVGAVLGAVWPRERWRTVRLP